MSKLLFIYERDMPTISITRDMFLHLHDERIQSTFIRLMDVKPEDVNHHDIIIFMRPNNTYSWKIAHMARKTGHVTVTFCDDDLLNLPKTVPTMPWRKKGLIKTLGESDIIWSSSRYIAEKYREMTVGGRVAITDTIVQPQELEGIEERNNTSVKVVYAAAPSHAGLFEKYIAPVISQIASEYDISLTFISVHPEVSGVQCEYVPGMPLYEYRKYMRDQMFDIGLAPLHNDEFSKCKYFNKFIEYTTQGIVGIYSNTEPYTYVVKNGVNGFLANDEPESWCEALRNAIRNKEERKTCLGNAIEYLREHHSEKACINRMIRDLPEIVADGKKYNKIKDFRYNKIVYNLFRSLDWFYLVVFYMKHTGINAVLKRTRTHFTEAKAYSRRRR